MERKWRFIVIGWEVLRRVRTCVLSVWRLGELAWREGEGERDFMHGRLYASHAWWELVNE